jgi:hypothetical protein
MNFYPVEPLVFSPISSKEEAETILKDNSYYIFIAAFISFTVFLLSVLYELDIHQKYYLSYGIYLFILAIAIRQLKSRIASTLALISFSEIIISSILESDIGGVSIFSFLFLAASYRAVKASFFYHKNLIPNAH